MGHYAIRRSVLVETGAHPRGASIAFCCQQEQAANVFDVPLRAALGSGANPVPKR
jgi:hypothetical protein